MILMAYTIIQIYNLFLIAARLYVYIASITSPKAIGSFYLQKEGFIEYPHCFGHW